MWESSREDRFESMKKHMVRLTLRLAELDLMLGFFGLQVMLRVEFYMHNS